MNSERSQESRVRLGHVTSTSGLRGWIKIHSETRPRENIVKYSSWWLEIGGNWKEFEVLDGRPQGKTIVAHLGGIDTPESASALIGSTIAVSRAAMPETAAGEYYWADLTGMIVSTIQGTCIGPVIRLFETGANDVMVVEDRREEGVSGKEILVPWLTPDVITGIDMDRRQITIDWDPDF